VTGHIVPWNYPMQILGRSVGAALAAGNTWPPRPAFRPGPSMWSPAWATRWATRWRATPAWTT
jgi:aldehyde dehydrogenase (NAD+)